MTSRERVKKALNFEKTDKVPIDFGGTVVSCMDLKAHENLLKHYGIKADAGPVIDYTMGTVEPIDELRREFKTDVYRVGLNVTKPDIINNIFKDGFGITFRKAEPHAYFDVVGSPLEKAKQSDIKNMQLPDPDNERMYNGLGKKAKDLFDNTDFALAADFGVPGFYETSQKLRGYENIACDLMIDIDFVRTLYDKLLVLQKRWFKNYLECVGEYVEVIGYADDLGMQDRLQVSPQVYREIIMPYHKQIFEYIHELADVKILLHSCGAIEPLIDDLIDAGVDILNPMQTAAKGMDIDVLKEKYGGRISFWGGMDEQFKLPFGAPEQIENEVKRLMTVMGKNGGYVFGPGHNLQADIAAENIVCMYKAANRYRNL